MHDYELQFHFHLPIVSDSITICKEHVQYSDYLSIYLSIWRVLILRIIYLYQLTPSRDLLSQSETNDHVNSIIDRNPNMQI